MRINTVSSGKLYTQTALPSTNITLSPEWESSSTEAETPTTSFTTKAMTTMMLSPTPTVSTLMEALSSSLPTLTPSADNLTAIFQDQDVTVDGGGGEGVNTPLNAPEPSLEPVTDRPIRKGDSLDVAELGWVLPIALVTIVIMMALAFALYHGVRKLELRMLGWCYRNCACCCAPGGGRRGGRVLRGEQYDTLSDEDNAGRTGGGKETVRLRDFREQSPTYGVTRKPSKEHSPNRETSPFDDGNS